MTKQSSNRIPRRDPYLNEDAVQNILNAAQDEAYIKAMFGQYARHVPAWYTIQNHGKGILSFIGSSMTASRALWGAEETHQFVVGELIMRPHLIIASDAFRGHGLGGMLFETDPAEWLSKGRIIFNKDDMK